MPDDAITPFGPEDFPSPVFDALTVEGLLQASGAVGFNIGVGAPASPADGAMWITAAGLFIRYNGTTLGPIGSGLSGPQAAATFFGGPISGSPAPGAFRPIGLTDLPAMSGTQGGIVPTPPNDATRYLDGTGHFSAPSVGGSVPVPGGGDVNKSLIATAAGVYGWNIPDVSKTVGILPATQLNLGTRLRASGTQLNAVGQFNFWRQDTGGGTYNVTLGEDGWIHNFENGNWVINLPTSPYVGFTWNLEIGSGGYNYTINGTGGNPIMIPGSIVNSITFNSVARTLFTHMYFTWNGNFWVPTADMALSQTLGWTSPPLMLATYTGANSNITSGVWTKPGLAATVDSHGWWGGTGTYTPKLAGTYHVSWSTTVGDGNGSAVIAYAGIYISGSRVAFQLTNWNGTNYLPIWMPISLTTLLYCNGSTDYLEPYVYVVGSAPIFQGGGCALFEISYAGP